MRSRQTKGSVVPIVEEFKEAIAFREGYFADLTTADA
jgi:hypothetical protein